MQIQHASGAHPTFCAGGEFSPYAAQLLAADAALALAAVPGLHTSSCDQLAAASARPLHPQSCSHKEIHESVFLCATHSSCARCIAPACHQNEIHAAYGLCLHPQPGHSWHGTSRTEKTKEINSHGNNSYNSSITYAF